MSTLKLYLIHIAKDDVVNIKTFRDIDTVKSEFFERASNTDIHILHSGFLRPEVLKTIDFSAFLKGKLLYSPAVKWALPSTFESSQKPVFHLSCNKSTLPCYLAINQWGYEVSEESVGELLYEDEPDNHYSETISSANLTITEAARTVLEEVNKPLNKEEIYALIIESELYQFNTQKPVHVLDVQLNRFTKGTPYSKAADNPLFGKTTEGRYFLLGSALEEPSGWIKVLSDRNPELYKLAKDNGISCEQDYLQSRNGLSESLDHALGFERFSTLLEGVDQSDPVALVRIVPTWILSQPISSLDLSVRSYNALHENGIDTVEELGQFTRYELLNFPNIGKKSISDISTSLIQKISSTPLFPVSESMNSGQAVSAVTSSSLNKISNSLTYQAEAIPLIEHLTRTLENLSEIDRLVMHGRLGFRGRVLTLEEVGEQLSVTRERVRQRQSKYTKRIIEQEYWDDMIGLKIGQLLVDRVEPLMIELLEVEDSWFKGFENNYVYLKNTIELFTENELRVIDANGLKVVTRITQNNWDALIKRFRQDLKIKATEKKWSSSDIEQHILSLLSENSAQELVSIIKIIFQEYMQYDGNSSESLLIAFGKSGESSVAAALAQAEGPLHYSEIARRATKILGKKVDARLAHNAMMTDGICLFDRGTYGLISHCPLLEKQRLRIRDWVEKMLYEGPINRQWHSREIIEALGKAFPDIAAKLDPYILRMSIEESPKLVFLNRMVWARSDSGMDVGDRIETNESFIHILEEAGEPLSGSELKQRLSMIRGVSENMQIHGNERLVAIGPNIWALSEWNSKNDN